MHVGTHASLEGHPDELEKVWLPWFKTLPFFLDFPELRIVHACWHPEYLKLLDGKTLVDEELLRKSSIKDTPEYLAVETVLKGVELPMPPGEHFEDHQGNIRTKFRARWWDKGQSLPTARNMLFPPKEGFIDTPLLAEDVVRLPGYAPAEKPVFIGHYYKPSGSCTEEEAPNLRCLDFSAAIDGPLVCFRWDGKPDLSQEKLVMVMELSEEEIRKRDEEKLKRETNAPRGTLDRHLNKIDISDFISAANMCALNMTYNSIYILKALPSLDVGKHHKEGIKVVCQSLILTKHGVINYLSNFDEALTNGLDKAGYLARAELVLKWLQEPIAILQNCVSLIQQDPDASLAFTLVAESGVNIMNDYGDVDDAYKALISRP